MNATVTTDPTDEIASAREQIDALDARIIELVRERAATSAAIQQARISAGGRRTDHARELQIVDRYARELGESGPTLALTVLEICRGRR